MQTETSLARRYHWCSDGLDSFVTEPHTAVCGAHQGDILNLTHQSAINTQEAMLEITEEKPANILQEIPHMQLPTHYGVKSTDVDLRRLGSVLWLAQEQEVTNFEDLLLLKGLGPRTLQSLTLVSEVIHGTPSRFNDPARFSFAHGSKGGKPFAVPTKVYYVVITTLKDSVEKSKINLSEKSNAIAKLTTLAQRAEQNFTPDRSFDDYITHERKESHKYGGRTIDGWEK